ncbi:hypothetical protein BS47DRAFT_1345233, partial [Hydnum rufescens UP504]
MRSWERSRRVEMRARRLLNPRFKVTDLHLMLFSNTPTFYCKLVSLCLHRMKQNTTLSAS